MTMTNRDYYQDVMHMSTITDMEAEHRKYCRHYGAASCSACRLNKMMHADPNGVGESCFTYWLKLDIAKTPREQEPAPSSSSSKPKPVNNETSFTMLDE